MDVIPGRTTTWLSNCTNTSSPAYTSDYRCLAIYFGRTIAASLSIVGNCLVLLAILLYKKYQNFTHRMLISVLVPDIIYSIVYFCEKNMDKAGVRCEIAGFLDNFCTLSGHLFVLCIVIHLLVFTFYNLKPNINVEIVFHLVVWPFSLITSIIPIFGNHYGVTGSWCWIKNESKYDNILRLVCLYLWLIMAIFFELVGYSLVVCKIHQQLSRFNSGKCSQMSVTEKKQLYKKYVYPLLFYPLVNFVIGVPATVNRFQNYFSPDKPIFVLYFLQCTLCPLWGFCIFVTYFANRETLSELNPCQILDVILSSWALLSSYLRERPSDLEAFMRENYIDDNYANDALIGNCDLAVEVESDSINLSVSDME